MMYPILIEVAAFVCSFLVLRRISLTSDEKHFSVVESFFIGLVAWVFLLSVLAWGVLTLYLLYLLLAERVLGSLFALIFIGMATGFAIQANEVLDASTVMHFVRRAVYFRPTKPRSVLLTEELDKKNIHDIHSETSDKPFPTADKERRLLSKEEVHQHQMDALAAEDRPSRSIHFEAEILKLKTGQIAHITDGWKIYTFSNSNHDLYAEMTELQIDPTIHTLQFRLNVHTATETALQDPSYVYAFKQDLYQLLQVVNTDPWLAWYSEFYEHIVVVCFGIEPDSFGHSQMFPFMRIDIVRTQLTQREGKFFNAGDLHTIAALTFANGKPLPEELL